MCTFFSKQFERNVFGKGNFKFSIGSINNKFLCGSGVAKHFLISLVFVKLRLQYGYECERSNANNYEPKLDKKDK